ncbi:uncharacterized protein [Antedon mediterranea]|uniref:uncharacterized protein n=1 Tax=Antedon mediterranea TaxID=105859 RepID=UPI003AF6E4A7
MYSNTPLTSRYSGKRRFRGYAIQEDKDIRDLSVGILYKNIDGRDKVTWNDTKPHNNTGQQQEKSMPNGKIFNTNSKIEFQTSIYHTFLGVADLQPDDRVGVFSFEAKKGEVVTDSAIVLTSDSAVIRMEYRTITVGIGEYVTINLSKGTDLDDLRWRHNYGEEIDHLRSNTSAVIENIRMKDDGVYECFTGDSPDGNHGIMRLIVRACPSPKWNPPDCEMDCPVCYNGGVCDDKTGVCICTAGFKGTSCKQGCGYNDWGRDCNFVCSVGGNCTGIVLSPPDPVGCTCHNGFGGNDCNTVCDTGFYGADCRQVCHCDSEHCDTTSGCRTKSMCLDGYTGEGCLVEHVSCSSGFFGDLCNFQCHCKDSENCTRDGSCDSGCHEAWAGPNCSIALPYRSEPPTIVEQTVTTVTFDVTWIPGEDYGTGTIIKRTLLYKPEYNDTWTSVSFPIKNKLLIIDNLIPNAKIKFRLQFFRMVYNNQTGGPRSNVGSTKLICSSKHYFSGLLAIT